MNNVKNEDHSLGMRHRVNRWVCIDVLDESAAFIIRIYETGGAWSGVVVKALRY